MSDAIEDVAWQNEPALVQRFLADRPRYEELGHEVAFILRKRLEQAGVACAGVPSRAKTLGSFLQKLERKRYESPFEQVFDFAGARVLCLYSPRRQR